MRLGPGAKGKDPQGKGEMGSGSSAGTCFSWGTAFRRNSESLAWAGYHRGTERETPNSTPNGTERNLLRSKTFCVVGKRVQYVFPDATRATVCEEVTVEHEFVSAGSTIPVPPAI